MTAAATQEVVNNTNKQSPSMPKKSNKRLIALLIGLVVVGVAALIALVVYFIVFYISDADYNHALAQTNTVISRYNTASAATTAYSSAIEDATVSDSTISQKAAAYKSAYNAYLKSVSQLENERALRNDKVKAAYDAFVAKNKAFVANNNTIEDAIPTLRKIAVQCSEDKVGAMDTSDLGQLVASYDSAVGPCAASMKSLASAKNVDAATIGKKASSYFDALRAHVVNMEAAYKASDRTKLETEYTAFLDEVNAFQRDTDISSISTHQKSLEPTAELNALAKVLSEQ